GSGGEVVMREMGEWIFEGTITKWLKKVGDKVQRDEPLFEISTDKVDAEIPAPSGGVLREIKVKEGTTVQVNTVVAVIGGAGAPAPSAPAPAAAPRAPEPVAAPATSAPRPRPSAPPPLARGRPSPPRQLLPPAPFPQRPRRRRPPASTFDRPPWCAA